MKIFQLIQKPQLRGAEVFACQLSTWLNKLGQESIIVPIFPGEAQLPFDGKILPLNANAGKRFSDYPGWKRLADYIKLEQPDVIQANAGDTLKYAAISRMLFGWRQPIVFRNASTISLYIKSAPAKLLNSFFLKQVAYVASVSNISREDFLSLFPDFSNRIKTIPIGVNPVDLPARQQNQQPVLIHVGGFTYEKNHKGLISIFEQVLQKQPGAVLWLVGDGPLRGDVAQLVKEKGLEEKVIFHGFRRNAMELIRAAEVLVLPSIIEGLPGVILEAFYCRTPVVAYDVGGVKEVVNTQTGHLVPLHQEQDFAGRIVNLLDRRCQDTTVAAFDLVSTSYLNEKIAKDFLAVYTSIIKG